MNVSAALRRGGLVPAPSTRDGIHVAAHGPDEVMVDTDCACEKMASELFDRALTSVRRAGYSVRVPQAEPATFYVTPRR